MARIRTVKPSFFTSRTVADLGLSARLTFIGLWTYCDDSGRGVDDARLVKAALWPLDDAMTAKRVEADLVALEKHHHIERYRVDGDTYLRIVEWHHQRINRPQDSRIPPSPSEQFDGKDTAQSLPTHGPFTEDAVNPHGTDTEDSPPEGKGREGKGKESLSHLSSLHPGRESGQAERRSDELSSLKPWPAEWVPSERAKARALTQRAYEILDANGGRPRLDDVQRLIVWAMSYLDPSVIDECVGTCAELRDKPRKVTYLAKAIADWGAQRGVTMPAFGGAR